RRVGLPTPEAPPHLRSPPRLLRHGRARGARRARSAVRAAPARAEGVPDLRARGRPGDLHDVVSLHGGHPERHQDASSGGHDAAPGGPVTSGTRAPVTSPLVTTDWLAANLGRRNVRVVDGSWHMPQLKRDALTEFAQAPI